MNGYLVSALIGVLALVLGLLILHFTPDNPHSK